MNKELDKHSPIPLYYQIKNRLMEDIKNKYEVGDKFYTEESVCKEYQVSRVTARKSLEELVQEGYINKKRGIGAIVCKKPKLSQDFALEIKSFNQEMLEKNMEPDTEVLELTVLEGDEEIRSKFDLETDEKLIKLVRLRFADGIPVVYVVTYFPQNIMPDFEKFDFKKNSYYEYLKKIGKKVSRVNRTFEAKIANPFEKNILKMDDNCAVAYFETIAFSKNEVVEYSLGSYNGEMNKFNISIG